MASFSITAPRRRRVVARNTLKVLSLRSGEEARATHALSRRDRAVGVACVVACPAISGLFVGLVGIVCAYPTNGGHAVVLGSIVGGITFAANALAICLIALRTKGPVSGNQREPVAQAAVRKARRVVH